MDNKNQIALSSYFSLLLSQLCIFLCINPFINRCINHCLNEYASCLAATVEKVAVLCRFLDIHSVTKNHLLKYSLAHAFCCFLTAVEDVNPAVATRAGLLLDTIKRPALQVGVLHREK